MDVKDGGQHIQAGSLDHSQGVQAAHPKSTTTPAQGFLSSMASRINKSIQILFGSKSPETGPMHFAKTGSLGSPPPAPFAEKEELPAYKADDLPDYSEKVPLEAERFMEPQQPPSYDSPHGESFFTDSPPPPEYTPPPAATHVQTPSGQVHNPDVDPRRSSKGGEAHSPSLNRCITGAKEEAQAHVNKKDFKALTEQVKASERNLPNLKEASIEEASGHIKELRAKASEINAEIKRADSGMTSGTEKKEYLDALKSYRNRIIFTLKDAAKPTAENGRKICRLEGSNYAQKAASAHKLLKELDTFRTQLRNALKDFGVTDNSASSLDYHNSQILQQLHEQHGNENNTTRGYWRMKEGDKFDDEMKKII
jgi:hypothetical protein